MWQKKLAGLIVGLTAIASANVAQHGVGQTVVCSPQGGSGGGC